MSIANRSPYPELRVRDRREAVLLEQPEQPFLVGYAKDHIRLVLAAADERIHIFDVHAAVGEKREHTRESARHVGHGHDRDARDARGVVLLIEYGLGLCRVAHEQAEYAEIRRVRDGERADVYAALGQRARERGELIMIPSFRGLFERLHCLRAFECVMEDLMLYPDECVEFFEAYTDWKLEAFKLLIDNLDFDIMHSHDDLGAKTKLFFSPQIYRDMLKPNYKRLYDYCHSRGILVQHHCDCFIEPFAIDFAEIGIDMWQGALPTNDIVKIQKELDEKGLNMLMMGGLEAAIVDNELATEEEIRAEVRRAIDTYGPGGHFLPCIGSINCLYEKNEVIAIDEMNRYGAEWIKKQQA